MSAKKIILINPPYSNYGGVKGHGGKNTPLNLAYIASNLRTKKTDIDIKIVDAEALELTLEEITKEVDRFTPDIIGITCPTPVYYIVKKLCDILKRSDNTVQLVLGGPHPTALPKKTLIDIPEVDVIFIGESEESFNEYIDSLDFGVKNFEKILGIAYRKNKEIVINPRRPLIKDLNQLSFPAKDLLPLEKYYLPPTKRIKSEQATNMITSRGCPFDCSFCMAKLAWRNQTRFRNISNVLDEVEENIFKYKLTEFSFHDELFTAKKKRVLDFCTGLLNRGLDISWVCMARTGTVDDEMLKLMKKAGCGKICFGFESGNEHMLKLMNKKANLSSAIHTAKMCKDAGISVEGTFILGYPGETIDTIKDTIHFAIDLDIDIAAFFIAIPFPGTKLYEIAIKKGYLDNQVKWEQFAPVSNLDSPMVIPTLSPAELQKWKSKAYRSFYLRPQYIIRKLGQLKNFADIKSLFRGVKIFFDIT